MQRCWPLALAAAKHPAIEQVASAAAAAQNMLLAAHALGLAGKWATGRNAYEPAILKGLGLGPDDRLLSFLYLGSYAQPQEPTRRPPVDDLVHEWQGPAS